MNQALFQQLLQQWFQGNHVRLREQLQVLDSGERKAQFKAFQPLLTILRRTCRYHWDAKPLSLKSLYRELQADPAAWLTANQDLTAGALFNNANLGGLRQVGPLYTFYLRLQMLQAGLAGKGGIGVAFRRGQNYPVAWGSPFVLTVGRVLLDRPEAWVIDALVKMLDSLERNNTPFGEEGLAQLVHEARQRYPDRADTLSPYLGIAMRWDGFQVAAWPEFGAEMILAGLVHEPSRQEAWHHPLQTPNIADKLVQLSNEDSLLRHRLLELVLDKLQAPLAPSTAKACLDLLARLEPDSAAYQDNAEHWLDLLNSPNNAAAKQALAIVKSQFLTRREYTDALLAALGYLLQHTTQTLAHTALRLYRQLLKAHPDRQYDALAHLVAAMTTPHVTVRSEILSWLARYRTEDFPPQALQQLQENAALLAPVETVALAPLLPASLADQADTSTEAYAPDLTSLLTTVRAQLTKTPNSAQQLRLEFLEHYLATGDCEGLRPHPPQLPDDIDKDCFPGLSSAEELALAIAKMARRPPTQSDWEQACAGILRFAEPTDADRIDRILQPLQQLRTSWSKPFDKNADSAGNIAALPAVILAHTWRGSAKEAALPRGSIGAQWQIFALDSARLRQIELLRRLRDAGHDTLLSTPTHRDGWLRPERFAQRLLQYPPALVDHHDLSRALYRLTPTREARRRAWELLEKNADPLLRLALGPESSVSDVLQTITRLQKNPLPTFPLIRDHVSLYSGIQNFLEYLKSLRPPVENPVNIEFQLFLAAWHCHQVLHDSRIAEHIPQYLNKLKPLGLLDKFRKHPKVDARLAAELLFQPKALGTTLMRELFPDTRINYTGYTTDYPPLLPYVLAFPYTFLANTPGLAQDYAFQYPALSQRLFEAGVYRQSAKEDGFRELTASLLALGAGSDIDTANQLEQLVAALPRSSKPRAREQQLDILLNSLHDARITPHRLARALAEQIRSTSQGYSYLDQALASLAASGRAGQITTLWALEQALASLPKTFTPKKLSAILDRLLLLLTDTGRSVQLADSRHTIEQLAAGKKKTLVRDKARLIPLTVTNTAMPLAVLAVVALLERQ